MKPVKVDKWDGTAVKNALDDAAKKVGRILYHNSFDFSEILLIQDILLLSLQTLTF